MPYKDVTIPETKDPKDYEATERRAEVYSMMLSAGHPDLINQTKTADYYGVSVTTINRDVKKLRETIQEELGTDADLIIDTVFQTALREKADEENWTEAVNIAERWGKWLYGRGGRIQPEDTGKDLTEEDAEEAYITMVEDAIQEGELGDPSESLQPPEELTKEAPTSKAKGGNGNDNGNESDSDPKAKLKEELLKGGYEETDPDG